MSLNKIRNITVLLLVNAFLLESQIKNDICRNLFYFALSYIRQNFISLQFPSFPQKSSNNEISFKAEVFLKENFLKSGSAATYTRLLLYPIQVTWHQCASKPNLSIVSEDHCYQGG